MAYVNQLDLPNSPSPTTSTAASTCWRTAWATAVRSTSVRVAASASGPSASTSGGRIRLPANVVRMRSLLRFMSGRAYAARIPADQNSDPLEIEQTARVVAEHAPHVALGDAVFDQPGCHPAEDLGRQG